jgi:hypothetical protein
MQPIDSVERLNAAVPPAHDTGRRHPLVADEIMSSLIEAFLSAGAEQRNIARAALTRASRWFLLGYAWERAEQAIRQRSGEMVAQGLLALAIEDGGYDARDSIMRMSILFRSAEILGLDATRLFANAADLAANPMVQTAMREFPARPPDERNFSYIGEKTTDHGFSYELQPWKFDRMVRRKIWLLKLRKFLSRNR